MARLSSMALLGIALLASACGGDEDTLEAFRVTVTPVSDCEQSGQGPVSCVDEAELSAVSVTGRWVFDYVGADTFVLLTEDGRTLPGVYFADDGRVLTTACTGTGGVCHFARVRSAGEDAQSGCVRRKQRLVDLTILDGVLAGELFDESFTDETCDTSSVSQLRATLAGTRVDEDVLAREEFKP